MERFDLSLIAIVKPENDSQVPRGSLYMQTLNISAGGVYLKTDRPLERDTQVGLELFLPVPGSGADKNMSLVKVSGTVIRPEANGMAVRFKEGYQIFQVS